MLLKKKGCKRMNKAGEVFYYDELQSPIGTLTICRSDQGICLVEFGDRESHQVAIQKWMDRWSYAPTLTYAPGQLEEAKRQLQEYFEGRRQRFELPLDLRGTSFQLQVWHALADIPYGEVCSYKMVAVSIGQPKAVRAVGGANNKNPVPIIIPCHRVIGANGSLVGFGGGLDIKQQLLRLEKAVT